MPDFDTLLLDAFPEGIIRVHGGMISQLNEAARLAMPGLRPGLPLPQALLLPPGQSSGTGIFSTDRGSCTFSASQVGEDQLVILRPDQEAPLTVQQLEGTLRQLRTFTAELLVEVEQRTDARRPDYIGDDFLKTYHRLFRLVDNADFLEQSTRGLPPGFAPVTTDLVALVDQIHLEALDLLAEAQVELVWQCHLPVLLVNGDVRLLRRLVLELISNAARFARPGKVAVVLRQLGQKAYLTVSDSGGEEGVRRLTAALSGQPLSIIPDPREGAGLGLAVARQIVALHQGSMLVDCGGDVPRVAISLPLQVRGGRTTLNTPTPEMDAGLAPVLVGLADVLPAEHFGLESLD